MLNAGPRSPRVALPVWLAITSLVPAQNAPENLPEPEKGPESPADPKQPALPDPVPAEGGGNTDLPEPDPVDPHQPAPEGTKTEPLPKPEMTGTAEDGSPALPIPQPPPEGAPNIPGSLPGDPSITPGAPLLPGADPGLLTPGELPFGADPMMMEGDPLQGGQADEGIFDDPLAEDLPPAETAPLSPFGADQGDFGFEEEREGFSFFFEGSFNYATNLELRETDEESTFYGILSPGFEYRSALSGRAINTITAEYLADFNFFFDSDLDDTIDHDFTGTYTHRGSRAMVELETTYLRRTDSNRFTQALTETSEFATTLDFSYRLSTKTKLFASAEYFTRSNNISSAGDNDVFTGSISALWDVTPKTDIGPAIRYANEKSGSIGDSESTALEVEVQYTHSKMLNFVINAGVEAASYEDEDTEYAPSGSFKSSLLLRSHSIPRTPSGKGTEQARFVTPISTT